MKRKLNLVGILVSILLISFLILLGLNYIDENTKYARGSGYFFVFADLGEGFNVDCLNRDFQYVIDLSPDNNLVEGSFTFQKKFREKCALESIPFRISILNNNPKIEDYWIDITENGELVNRELFFGNYSNDTSVWIQVNLSKLKDLAYYGINFRVSINDWEFHNLYNAGSRKSWGNDSIINFYYKRKDYLCEENCFVNKAKISREDPLVHILGGFARKRYYTNDASVAFMFNPLNKGAVTFERIMDAILTGMVVSLVWAIITHSWGFNSKRISEQKINKEK